MKELFAEHDFKWLLGSQFVGQAADGLAQAVVATVLVLDPLARGTPERILELFALTLIPYSLISPFLGVFVDRWDRRRLLIGTNGARAILLLLLPVWGSLIDTDAALSLAVLGLLGFGRLFSTTKGAVLPVVLHEHHLLRGNTLSNAGGVIAALAGGAAGLGIAQVLEASPAMAAAGMVHVLGAMLAWRIRIPLTYRNGRLDPLRRHIGRITRSLRDGISEIYRRPGARLPLIGIFLLRASAMIVVIAAVIVVKQEFPGAGEEFGRFASSGALLAFSGLGAFLGAFFAPWLGRRFSRAQLILVGFVISGLSILVFGAVVHLISLAALMTLGGFGGFITKVAVDAQVQHALPDDYRGRAFALYDILYNLASVAAAAAVVASGALEIRWLLVSTGAAVLVTSALLGTAMSKAGVLLRAAPG